MNIVPFPGVEAEDLENLPVQKEEPRVTAEFEPLYRELFEAADRAVMMRPWERLPPGKLFQLPDAEDQSGEVVWEASLQGEEAQVCAFCLREEGGAGRKLVVQFVPSDFLQGEDYELNVCFAPEAWDGCERDVIVVETFSDSEEPRHPNEEELALLIDALRFLNMKYLHERRFETV
jgi:hypothetical protein